jgi:hypothetical protein
MRNKKSSSGSGMSMVMRAFIQAEAISDQGPADNTGLFAKTMQEFVEASAQPGESDSEEKGQVTQSVRSSQYQALFYSDFAPLYSPCTGNPLNKSTKNRN